MNYEKKFVRIHRGCGSYIFDLDGTLADISIRRDKALDVGRTKYNAGKQDKRGMCWDTFFDPKLVKTDKLKVPVANMLQLIWEQRTFYNRGYKRYPRIIIFSGRADTMQEETRDWLDRYGVKYDALLMRPMDTDQFTSDVELKERWLDALLGYYKLDYYNKVTNDYLENPILGVFDDRNGVVDMWRRRGLTCFQVAPGDF